MDPINAIAILITLATVFVCINYHFLKVPTSIALMLMSLGMSLSLILMDQFGLPVRTYADQLVGSIDFTKVLLKGMLGLLLFAGALHVNINDLTEQKLEIGIYASMGVITSTVLVGLAVYVLSCWIEPGLRPVDCFLFGALISPTDPIAVLGILKKAGAPKSLETKIAGESLFNDGIAVVVFLILLKIATGEGHITPGFVAFVFAEEVAGGAIFGLVIGYAAYSLLKSVNEYQAEVMITLSLVIGGYALGSALHISEPIAIVVAGLLIGNHGRRLAMSDISREHLDTFWELVDEILNSVLYVLIGLEVLVLTLDGTYLTAGIIAVPIVLLARLVSVGIPTWMLRRWRDFVPNAILIMTWGGLRGGISVALALSLPEQCHRELILTMTYVVVVFSVLVQGMTIKRFF